MFKIIKKIVAKLRKLLSSVREAKPNGLNLHEEGEFISDHIRKTGRYYEADMLYYILQNFDTSRFIDIGANIGNHSNFFERHGGIGWAFEPSSSNYKKLASNVEKTTCYNVALSDDEGQAELVTFESSRGNNYLKSSFNDKINNWGTGVNFETVMVATLDSFGINAPTFIKIDVEGSELKVLKGATQTLTKYNPVLAIEMHTDETLLKAGFPYSRRDIEEFLGSLGYQKIASYDETNHFYGKLTK